MPHPKAGMAPLLQISGRAAEAVDQKFAKAVFCTLHIVPGIHRSQDVIGGDLPVECRHQPLKSVFANQRVYFLIIHSGHSAQYRIIRSEALTR